MGKQLNYVNLRNMRFLTKGLSFQISRTAEVLDAALSQFNKQNGVPDKIVDWNRRGGNKWRPMSFPGRGRFIVDIRQSYSAKNGLFDLAQVVEKHDKKETAPAVFFSMHSPTLDIPMRVEVPLRALIKGCPDLSRSYCVYLHALISDDGNEYTYYGITKRGWNLRFLEHTKAAFPCDSQRLFPRKLNELLEARVASLAGRDDGTPELAGIVSAICSTGLDEEDAMDTEEYLVEKYSLASKHPFGLNMIPGGRKGIRSLHRTCGGSASDFVDTEEREEELERSLSRNRQIGVSGHRTAEMWNNPDYVEAVICGRKGRLSADSVREIRRLVSGGAKTGAIRRKVGAIDDAQVRRVLQGHTYTRIR